MSQEMCSGQPSFLVSSDCLEMMLTSYYLFMEGAGDPDSQVTRQGVVFVYLFQTKKMVATSKIGGR